MSERAFSATAPTAVFSGRAEHIVDLLGRRAPVKRAGL